MKSASENLVPVTLELGGKSPVIVDENADLKNTATKVMRGKTMNAGQICLAPDYALVPEEKVEEFVQASVEVTSEMYPDMKDNDDFTSIVNQKHFDRIQGLLEDAKEKGADIVETNTYNEDFFLRFMLFLERKTMVMIIFISASTGEGAKFRMPQKGEAPLKI